MDQKMLRFWRVIMAKLKIAKFAITLSTSNFQKLFKKIDSKSSQFE